MCQCQYDNWYIMYWYIYECECQQYLCTIISAMHKNIIIIKINVYNLIMNWKNFIFNNNENTLGINSIFELIDLAVFIIYFYYFYTVRTFSEIITEKIIILDVLSNIT